MNDLRFSLIKSVIGVPAELLSILRKSLPVRFVHRFHNFLNYDLQPTHQC